MMKIEKSLLDTATAVATIGWFGCIFVLLDSNIDGYSKFFVGLLMAGSAISFYVNFYLSEDDKSK